MNYNRSPPNSGHPPSPPPANCRNHLPGAEDGAGDGPGGENAFMPVTMALPLQMMSTLQARLEQAAMAGDGPHSTLAERARYAAMFQNMEQQLQQLHQHRNQQQQVQSLLSPSPTPLPMLQSMQFRRASRISQNQQNQQLQKRQQQQLRESTAMESFREREQRIQQREYNDPQQIPSVSTQPHGTMLHESELHCPEIDRYKFAIPRQYQIEMQHLDSIARDLSQCEERLLQFAMYNDISIPRQNPLTIFSNLDNEQTAHVIQPSIHTGAGMQQLTQPLLEHSRLTDIITVNINTHATQDDLSSNAISHDPNNLLNYSSTQWPGGNQFNGGSVTNNGIAHSMIRTFQILQAVTENANHLTAFFHSEVINANRQNTGGNPLAAVSFGANQTCNMPGVHSQVQEWQHFAKIAHENLSTANRITENLSERPELYRQCHNESFPRTKTSSNVNVSKAVSTITGSSTINPTTSPIASASPNLTAASGVTSEDESQTINELNTQMASVTINPVATNENIPPMLSSRNLSEARSPYNLPSSIETSRVFGSDESVISTTEVQMETNEEEYILYEENDIQNNNNFTFNEMMVIESNYNNYNHGHYSEACNGTIEHNHDFMGRNITNFQYFEPYDFENGDNFIDNDMEVNSFDINYNHGHFGEATTGAINDNYLENHVLESNNFTDLHYLHPNGVENSNSFTVNYMEPHSFDNSYIHGHFSEAYNGDIEGNHLDNDVLENNDFDTHYIVANDVENRCFECNLMENNVLQNNVVMGCPFYECNNSENHDWTCSHLENNYIEGDEMVNSNHTCTSTSLENSKCLENNGLQVNGLVNSNCAGTLFLENQDLNYNNFGNNNILQDHNFMESNQHPFVEFNNLESHNLNWNNCDFLEDYEDRV